MVRINLLPIREILRNRYLKRFIVVSCAALAGTVGIMILWYIVVSVERSNLDEHRAKLQKRQAVLAKDNEDLVKKKNDEGRLKKQVYEIRKLVQDRDSIERFMAAISRAIPDDVWLESLEKNQSRDFLLKGKGSDNNSIINFVDRLQTIKANFSDGNPYLDSSRKDEQAFFGDVKLLEVSAAPEGKAVIKGSMDFKIIGRLR